jgi:hypothetical protein
MPEAGQRSTTGVGGGQFQALCCRSLKRTDLVAQSQVLELEGGTRSEGRAQRLEESREKNEHQREL